MSVLIGTGFIHGNRRDEFASLWVSCVRRYTTLSVGSKLVVLAVHDSWVPSDFFEFRTIGVEGVSLTGNLGHVSNILDGSKPYPFCGWSMTLLTLALLAYQNESDLIFIEQDCLVFGDYVTRMYEDMGTGDMVFGGKMKSHPFMPCAQGLVLIRHSFIPTFVAEYIQLGDERRTNKEGKDDNLPEDKFAWFLEKDPGRIKTLSFGVDRERPIPYEDPVFYAQQLSDFEIQTLQQKGLL